MCDDGGAAAVRRTLARELVAAARKHSRPSVTTRMRQALSTITSFNTSIGATGVSLGVEARPGRADSGDPEFDLLDLAEDVSLALAESGAAFGVFVDEMQDLDPPTLSALIAAQHAAGQRDWPFYVIGAGLPNLPRTLTETRSYAERLFNYRPIGQLASQESRRALVEPVQRLGARFEEDAVRILLEAAGGYPYFLQEYGQAIWNLAPAKTFTTDDANAAVQFGREHLDGGFFRSRWERATPAERAFLTAMAEDGGDPSATGDIARRMHLKVTSITPHRAKLIAKGLVYAPEHGKVAYTVPGMAEYVHRNREEV